MRIRTVKPEFWSHPIYGRLAGAEQAFLLSLLNYADDAGLFLADPSAVRSAVRPFDEDSSSVRRMLDLAVDVEWVEIRNHPRMGRVGLVRGFSDHQRIDRASPSKLLKYWENATVESSTSPRRVLDDRSLLEQGTGNREQGTGNGGAPAASQPPLAMLLEPVPDPGPTAGTTRPSDALCKAFERIRGAAYVWQGAKDGVALARLLKAAPESEVLERWERGLQATGWLQVATVAQLASKWNDLAPTAQRFTHNGPTTVETSTDAF